MNANRSRRRRTLLASLAALTILSPGARAAPATPGAPADTALLAAAHEAPLSLPDGVSLAGYGNLARRSLFSAPGFSSPFASWFKPSSGTITPLRARAFLLERPGEARLLFLSLEVVAVSAGFRAALSDRLAPLGFARSEVHVFATHTHSGPAGISDNPFWQIAATDRFQPELYESLIAQSVRLVEETRAALEPASLTSAVVRTENLQMNRRTPGGPVETAARLLLARRKSGSYLGGFLNYAMHGTALRPMNLFLSPDAPGALTDAAEDVLWGRSERRGPRPVVLFLAGVEGDVNPNRFGLTGLGTLRNDFQRQLEARLGTPEAPLRFVPPFWTQRDATLELGTPRIRARNCIADVGLGFLGGLLPTLDASRYFGNTVSFSRVAFGDPLGGDALSIALWPGEPTTRLGGALLASGAWVVSLADDYLAYFTTPEEFAAGGYEACMNFYGPDGGVRILEGLRALAAPASAERP